MGCACIQLNDIVDENVFIKRMENALEIGGKENFWKNFFSCEDRCLNGEKVIYLITDYQLELLYNWWIKNIKSPPKTLKEIQPSHKSGKVEKTPDEKFFAEDYICCVCYTYDYYARYKRVFFNYGVEEHLNNDNVIIFFKGKISAESPVKVDAADHEQRIMKLLGENSKIKGTPKHGHRAKEVNDNEKWLYYLSLDKIERLINHPNIEYCINKGVMKDGKCESNCPFTKEEGRSKR